METTVTSESIESVDISKIKVPKLKWKRKIEDKDIEELAASLKQLGQLQPVVVRKKGKFFQLLAGEHRLAAARKNGFDEIEAKIVNASDTDATIIGLEENLRRFQPSSSEFASALAEYKKLWESKNGKAKRGRPAKKKNAKVEGTEKQSPVSNFAEDVSKRLGLSTSRINTAINLTENLHPEVKEAWKSGDISEGQAVELVSLDPDKQKKLLPKVKGETRSATRTRVKVEKTEKKDKKLVRLLTESIPKCNKLNKDLKEIIFILEGRKEGELDEQVKISTEMLSMKSNIIKIEELLSK